MLYNVIISEPFIYIRHYLEEQVILSFCMMHDYVIVTMTCYRYITQCHIV